MARLVYNTTKGRLQRNLADPSPVQLGDVLRLIRGSTVPVEFFQVDDYGGYTTPTASDYSLSIARPSREVNSGLLALTWTGTTEKIDLSGARLAPRIEAALNAVEEVDTAGGVDVAEVVAGRLYTITFRSVGARSLATAAVTATALPADSTITEASAGSASARAVQLLELQESPLAEIQTDGWTANASPTVAVAKSITGSATVREVETITISGDVAQGGTFAIGTSRQIDADAKPSTLTTTLNEDLGAGTIRQAVSAGRRKWVVYWESVGVVTTLAEGSSNLTRQPGLTASLDLDTTALKAAMRDYQRLSALATIKNITTGEILVTEQVSIFDPGAELSSDTMSPSPGITDSDGDVITDTDGNPI